MKQFLEEELLLRRFLLGGLSPSERSEVEERLFSDPEYFNQFRAAEDDLIDEYLYGDLDADERARFEGNFLTTPERRESLVVAKALRQYILKSSEVAAPSRTETDARHTAIRSLLDILRIRNPLIGFSAAAVLLLLIGFLTWLAVRTSSRNEPIIEAKRSGTETPRPQLTPVEPPRNTQQPITEPSPGGSQGGDVRNENGNKAPRTPRRPPAQVYSFLILPLSSVRGEGETNEVKVPTQPSIVKLQMPLEEEVGYNNYWVALQTEDGVGIKSWGNLKAVKGVAGHNISVTIPARLLKQKKYRLVLSASNSGSPRIINTFHFRVVK